MSMPLRPLWPLLRTHAGRMIQSVAGVGLLFIVCSMFPFATARAQLLDAGPLRVRGGISAKAEAYTVRGIDRRRAPASLETMADLSFNLFGLQSGIDLTYSTDQSQLRQSISQLAFRTAWSWGEVSAGDVSPSLAKYGLRGTTLRGGMAELEPRLFRFALAAGRSQEAIAPTTDASPRASAYRQMTYGGRVGYGRERGSHAYLTGIYVRDVAGSIDAPSSAALTPVQGGGVLTPQENWNLTSDLGLSLLQRRLSLRTEATVSLLTRNIQSPEVDDLLPANIGFLNVRRSSYVDYAGDATLRLNLPAFGLRATYERIQPGFKSLGVPQMRSDQERIRVQPRVSLLNRRLNVSLNGARTRNNLENQLLSTATRWQVGGSVQARLAAPFTVSSSYMRLTNENVAGAEAPNPAQIQLHQITQTASLTPTLTLRRPSGTTHAVSLSGSYQTTDDQSDAVDAGLRPAANTQNRSATLSYSLRLPVGLRTSLTGNHLTSEANTSTTDVLGLNAGVGYAFLDEALQVNLNAGWSRNKVTSQQTSQAALSLLNSTINFTEAASANTSDATNNALWTTRPVYVHRLDEPTAYAWLVNDLLHGTTEQVPSTLEVLFAQGIYNAQMLNQLTQTFESLSSQWTATLSSSYQLPNGDMIHLTVRGLISRADAGADFRESQATLRFEHRF